MALGTGIDTGPAGVHGIAVCYGKVLAQQMYANTIEGMYTRSECILYERKELYAHRAMY